MNTQTGIVLENRQAPGDVLMLTAAVRDLHRSQPGRFTVEANTTSSDIWKHNPGVVPLRRGTDIKLIKAGYSDAIRQCNQRRGHFAGGFVHDLRTKLGVPIRLTELRPAVYLSDAEIDPANRRVKEPYWLLMSGGKSDFTAKIWDHADWQAVADALAPDTVVVQAGARHASHRPLSGVTSLIGDTGFRDLMCLAYHADGIICHVTCLMHLAAGFNKPCVVIAGGREPWWWEAYNRTTWEINCDTRCPDDFIEHTYLHTMGDLPCCRSTGCWKSGIGDKPATKNCVRVVDGSSQKQPECMTMITPAIVTAAVRHYMDGGRSSAPGVTYRLTDGLNQPITNDPMPAVSGARGRVPAPVTAQRATAPRPYGGHRYRRSAMQERIRNARLAAKTRPAAAPVGRPAVRAEVQPAAGWHKVTIATCLYGDYPDIARRCIDSLYATVGVKEFELRIGMNAIGKTTRDYIESDVVPRGNVRIYDSAANIFKYPMMRRMLNDDPLDTEWVIWFDDDSYAGDPLWLQGLRGVMSGPDKPDVIGHLHMFRLRPGQIPWIQDASWYRGVPVDRHAGSPISRFVLGGWFAARSQALSASDWPDPRLRNNGGDVMFGCACKQMGFVIHNYHSGVVIGAHARRGASHRHPGM